MKPSTVKKDAKQTTYGRPRLLSHEEILDGSSSFSL